MIFTLTLAGVLFLIGVISVIRFNTRKPGEPPIKPSYVPFVGDIVPFGIDFLKFMKSGTGTYGKIWTTKLMGNRVTVVGHRDLHETFFKQRNDILDPSEVYKFMKPVFGAGVVYDAPHHKMREQLGFVADQLGQSSLKKFVPIIQNKVRQCLAEDWGDSGTLNLLDAMGSMLISTASLCLYGENAAKLASPSKISHILGEIEAGLNPIAVFIHWLPSFGYFRQRKARKEFEQLAKNILDERRSDPDAESRTDIINALLNAVYRDGVEMTDHERIGIMLGVIFAGQHTSLITSTWVLCYLSNASNAELLRKHREEMSAYSHEGELDWEGLNEMLLTDACFKEVLRVHPPLIMLMRKVMKPVDIHGFTVPKGDTLAISPLASHRHNDVYKSADDWNPERWLDSSEGKGAYDFIGFGAGTHRCLGERFGTMQTKVVISTILNDYDIELVQEKVPVPDYTTMVVGPTKNQTMIRYQKRH
eukprot:TRINITY_DN13914_c5_g1_i1.p1 TRINITY_DN13914_c5_g1~~TRINITY_DN13914_c5_g1_i1.p1  ORF type:complete len:495 (+),score=74.45 TRINITY_DN13914_c5_g1_i1:62-1486(+)